MTGRLTVSAVVAANGVGTEVKYQNWYRTQVHIVVVAVQDLMGQNEAQSTWISS